MRNPLLSPVLYVVLLGIASLLIEVTWGTHPSACAEDSRLVDKSKTRGARFLLASLRSLGSESPLLGEFPLGCRALTAWALLDAGERHNSGAIKRLFADLEKYPHVRVYSVAMYAIALDARWRAAVIDSSDPSDAALRELQKSTEAEIHRCGEWLIGALEPRRNLWGYFAPREQSPLLRVDLSNSAVAMWALQVARRHGFVVENVTALKIIDALLASSMKPELAPEFELQELVIQGLGWWSDETRPRRARPSDKDPDPHAIDIVIEGSSFRLTARPHAWPYSIPVDRSLAADDRPSFAMTAAAVSCLMILRSWLPEDAEPAIRAIDHGIIGALTTLHVDGALFSTPEKRLHQHSYYHSLFLYDLVHELGGIDQLGRNARHPEHAERLVKEQTADGPWPGLALDPELRRIRTAFAVLHLARSARNLHLYPPGLEIVRMGGAGASLTRGIVYLQARNATYSIEAVFESLIATPDEDSFQLCREIFDALPPTEAFRLLPRLKDLRAQTSTDIVAFAVRQVTRVTGLPGDATDDQLQLWKDKWVPVRSGRGLNGGDRIAALQQYLETPLNADILKRAAIDILESLTTLEAGAPLLHAMRDNSSTVRGTAHRAFCNLIASDLPFRNEGTDTEREEDLEAIDRFWRENEKELRFQIAWRRLRRELNACDDAERRAELRDAVAELGDRVLPEIESILTEPRFPFDWVLVWESITGSKHGL